MANAISRNYTSSSYCLRCPPPDSETWSLILSPYNPFHAQAALVAGPFSSHRGVYYHPYHSTGEDGQNEGRRCLVDGSGLPLGRGFAAVGTVFLISTVGDAQGTATEISSPETLGMLSGYSDPCPYGVQR